MPVFCGAADTLASPQHQANAIMRKTRVMPLFRKHSPAKIVVKAPCRPRGAFRADCSRGAYTYNKCVTTSHRVDALVPDASRKHASRI